MANDRPNTLGDLIDVARRRWIYLVTVFPAAVLVAVYLAFTLPPIYRSSATIILESSSIPQELIRTTVTAYADQQLERVRRSVLTLDNLQLLVEEIDPYPEAGELSARDKARLVSQNTETERVDPITLEPLPESDAFTIYYYSSDPVIATEVTGRLAEMFLSYNRETRTQQAVETYNFLQTQSEEAKDKVAETEQKLADFKEQYGNALPESQARIQQALVRLGPELESLQQEILRANDRKRTLELELSQINPNLFDPAGDWRAELAELQAQLAVAQQRYTDDHPDVRRLRRSIEALAARVDGATTEPLRPDNPDYIIVASQLDTVNRELTALQSRAARARQEKSEYERSLRIAPEVEREYKQLLRENEIAQERFLRIEASLSEAALGQVLESEARGERLTLIRPPYQPEKPYSPNRLGVIMLGMVLGVGLAAALVAVRESVDPTIRSARDLEEITDIKHLAAIPFIPNQSDKRRHMLAWGTASVIGIIAVVFVGSAVF
jgi:polysaccharide chain length determinant protein (PEP-CTERM system associated)